MHHLSIRIAIVCLALSFSSHSLSRATAAEPAKPPMQAYLEKLGFTAIPLELKDNHHVLAGRLNGRSLKIMVDTGCSITTVSTAVGKRLKSIEETGRILDDPVLGKLKSSDYKLIEELELGPVKLQMQPARVRGLDLGGRRGADMIIGMDFLARFHCLIDCLELRLYICAKAPPEPVTKALRGTLEKSGFKLVPAPLSQQLVMTCAGRINGEPVTWLVDTGGFWTMMDNATLGRLKLPQEFTGWRAVGVGKTGSTKLRVTEFKEIELGGVKLRWVDVGVADLSNWRLGQGEDDLLKVDGILGMDQLVKNNVLIDCASGELWVHPGDADQKAQKR